MESHVVFGVSSWGLGHATRDLVLLRALLDDGWRVTIVATGPALRLLQGELGDRCDYLDWPDMPCSIADSLLAFVLKTTWLLPRIIGVWLGEQRRLRALLRRESIDLVISDHRYGMVTDAVPMYFISHSIRYIAPWRSQFMENAMEWFMSRWLGPARRILVPDDPDEKAGLSGEMGHGYRYFERSKLVYLGILSSVRRSAPTNNLDLFISISGPEPQRSRFAEIVLAQLPALSGRVVVTLGLPSGTAPPAPGQHTVYAYLDRAEQQAMFNRAALVVCRSGYTTLMELAELRKPALLIPTPGQTEQLYLADTLRERGCFYSVRQDQLQLERDTAIAARYPGYPPRHDTDAAIQRFRDVIAAHRRTGDA